MPELMNASKLNKLREYRLFVSLNYFHRPEILDIQNRCKNVLDPNASVKWVEPQNLHLTLQFLGHAGPGSFSAVKNQLNKLSGEFKSPEIIVQDLQMFSKRKQPSVLFLSVESNPELENLSLAVNQACFYAGFPKPEKKPVYHITLGRIRRIYKPDLFERTMSGLISRFCGFTLGSNSSFCLMNSLLSTDGPEYQSLCEYRLRS